MTILAKAAIGVLVVAGVALWWARTEGPLRSPHAALGDFYAATNRAEDQLTDPLVLNGARVRPLLVQAIADPSMKLRRYAIAYLGCSEYEPALPALERIALDASEHDHFRGDALESFWLTRPDKGAAIANRFVKEPNHLGSVARGIVAGTADPYCRSWWQAFRHVHE